MHPSDLYTGTWMAPEVHISKKWPAAERAERCEVLPGSGRRHTVPRLSGLSRHLPSRQVWRNAGMLHLPILSWSGFGVEKPRGVALASDAKLARLKSLELPCCSSLC